MNLLVNPGFRHAGVGRNGDVLFAFDMMADEPRDDARPVLAFDYPTTTRLPREAVPGAYCFGFNLFVSVVGIVGVDADRHPNGPRHDRIVLGIEMRAVFVQGRVRAHCRVVVMRCPPGRQPTRVLHDGSERIFHRSPIAEARLSRRAGWHDGPYTGRRAHPGVVRETHGTAPWPLPRPAGAALRLEPSGEERTFRRGS